MYSCLDTFKDVIRKKIFTAILIKSVYEKKSCLHEILGHKQHRLDLHCILLLITRVKYMSLFQNGVFMNL